MAGEELDEGEGFGKGGRRDGEVKSSTREKGSSFLLFGLTF